MSIKDLLLEHQDQIIQQYQAGLSTNKIAKQLNCNAGSIYLFLQSCGISIRKRQKFIGNIEDYSTQILDRFDKGESATHISKQIGISVPAIIRILYKNGRKLEASSDPNNLLKNKKDEVVGLYLLGYSTNKIANLIGHSSCEVWKLLQKLNINTSDWKYNVDETFFQKIDTQEKAYILGWFYSDGCVDTNGKMRIGIQENDKHILEEIAQIMKYDGPLYFSNRKAPRKNLCTLCINRKVLADDLIKCGCIPNKSLILTFPDNIVPNELLSHFCRGMSDGDGSITKNYWSLTTSDIFNKRLQEVLLNKLNIESKYYYRRKNKNTCSLFISKQQDKIKFLDWLYNNSTIHLKRKYNKYLELRS